MKKIIFILMMISSYASADSNQLLNSWIVAKNTSAAATIISLSVEDDNLYIYYHLQIRLDFDEYSVSPIHTKIPISVCSLKRGVAKNKIVHKDTVINFGVIDFTSNDTSLESEVIKKSCEIVEKRV